MSKEIASDEEIVQYCMNDEDWTEKVGKPFYFSLPERKNHFYDVDDLAKTNITKLGDRSPRFLCK